MVRQGGELVMKNHSIFIRLLSAFLVFITLPLFFVGTSFVQYSKKYMTKDFIEKQEIKSNNLWELVTYWNTQIGTDTIHLSQNDAFKNYQRMSSPGEHLEETYAICDLFQDFTAKNDVLKSVYFYNESEDVIFSSLSGVQNFNDFPDTNWLKSISESSLLNQLHLRLDIDSDYSGHAMYSPEYVLTWICAVQNGKYLVANISCSKLSKIITESTGRSNFIVTDQSSIILLSDYLEWIGQDYDQLQPIPLKNSLILAAEGTGYINTYLIADNSNLTNAIDYMNLFVYLVCGILILVFIFVAYFTARKLYSPINDIMETLAHTTPEEITGSKTDKIKDELALFHSALHTLNNQRQELMSMVSNYEHTVRNTIFSDYLQSNISCQEFIEKISLLGFSFTNCIYQLFLFSPMANGKAAYLMETLDHLASRNNQGLCFKLTKDIYIFIQFEESGILSEYETELFHHYLAATCCCEQSIDVLPLVYKKVLFTLNHAIYYNLTSGIVRYETILNADMNDTMLPEQYLQGILQSIATNNINNLKKHTKQLFQFLCKQMLNYQKCRNLLVHLLFSLQKTLHLDEKDLIQPFYEKKTLKEAELFIFQICSTEINNRKKNTDTIQNICLEIKNFIDKHYHENINLVNLADPYHISYPYLSKKFKEQEKCTLIDYLNIVRIEKSKKLLHNSNMTLTDIAQQVGYNNVQSYQRFFKKLEGITPNTFRQLK